MTIDKDGFQQETTGDIKNIQGKVVNSGKHICWRCKREKEAEVMHWTTNPKICIACYYEI
jgi:ribosomal protein L40E